MNLKNLHNSFKAFAKSLSLIGQRFGKEFVPRVSSLWLREVETTATTVETDVSCNLGGLDLDSGKHNFQIFLDEKEFNCLFPCSRLNMTVYTEYYQLQTAVKVEL